MLNDKLISSINELQIKKKKNNENEEHAQVLFLFIFLPTELDGIDSNNSILIRCLIYIRILIIGYIIFHAKIREYQYHSLIDSEKNVTLQATDCAVLWHCWFVHRYRE